MTRQKADTTKEQAVREEQEASTETLPGASSEPAGGPGDTVSQGSSAALEERLAAVEAERDEYLADLQRIAAEYENYRKRVAREQERLVAHAHERLVRDLLPVLDDLERAAKPSVRESGPGDGIGANGVQVPPAIGYEPDPKVQLKAVLDGVRLVEKALRAALAKEGLAEIPTEGTFDPHVHEALMSRPDEGAEPGSVLEVVQRGYSLGGRVVRPARVIVAE